MRIFSVVLLCGLLLAACGEIDPNSPQAKRQALFKQMLASSEELGGMLRGRLSFSEKKFSEGALRLDQLAGQPWVFFPAPQRDAQGTVDADMQRKHEQFQLLARELEAGTAALRAVSSQPGLSRDALQEPLARVEASCKRCHEAFRSY